MPQLVELDDKVTIRATATVSFLFTIRHVLMPFIMKRFSEYVV